MTGSPSGLGRRWCRSLTLTVVLVLAGMATPPAAVRMPDATLVRVGTARAVGHSQPVVWILCLGSDARPGESLTRSRSDAIQLVGVNLDTGAGTVIGVPRDSYVRIRGHGRNKINASMDFGGPRLMADSVARLVGVRPDYVFTTGFQGFRTMVRAIGGVKVRSRFSFSDPVLPHGFKKGANELTPRQALVFGRVRHALPRGDFDRSANQQALLRGILRRVRANAARPGFMERGLLAAARSLATDLSPAELFRLGHAVATVRPERLRGCVLRGRTGFAGAASVVFPNVARAHRLGRDVRHDATVDHRC